MHMLVNVHMHMLFVVVAWTSGRYAVDQATGTQKWSFTTGDEVDAAVVVDPIRSRVIAVSNDNKCVRNAIPGAGHPAGA